MKNPNICHLQKVAVALLCALTALSAQAAGFNSGSTGVDGAFSPAASTTITVPASGRFDYTTVNIPSGVTVKYVRNPANPNVPVILLATGNVTIAGSLDVSGGDGLLTGVGVLGDRSSPGVGGPGAFDGGRGGLAEVSRAGGSGLGPGGGGSVITNPGGGGGYGLVGGNAGASVGGVIYGSNLLTPLLGGSGGGGGSGAPAVDGLAGTGGGGGGGAILIASSGIVTLNGSIVARGGNGGSINSAGVGGSQMPTLGGGGSGGAIRIVSSAVTGAGTLNVTGGSGGTGGFNGTQGAEGGRGRTSIEVPTTGTLSLGGVPTLAITSVAGVSAPAAPTGTGDVSIPAGATNPAAVAFSASGVPVGNTIALTLTPQRGAPASATSTPLAGSTASSTATANINIPQGISTLTASASYTITVAMGDALSVFAQNERVEKVTLSATYGGPSTAKLTTVSGKEYEVPADVLRIAASGG
jgi:hypothetical protein